LLAKLAKYGEVLKKKVTSCTSSVYFAGWKLETQIERS
jgi:hypothetical protein